MFLNLTGQWRGMPYGEALLYTVTLTPTLRGAKHDMDIFPEINFSSDSTHVISPKKGCLMKVS